MAVPPAGIVAVPDTKDQKWPERLVGALNSFMAATKNALANALTIGENFRGVLHTFEFTYIAATPPVDLFFSWPYAEPPRACFVVRVDRLDATAISAAVQVLWQPEGGRVRVTSFLGGFTNLQRYRVTVLALA